MSSMERDALASAPRMASTGPIPNGRAQVSRSAEIEARANP